MHAIVEPVVQRDYRKDVELVKRFFDFITRHDKIIGAQLKMLASEWIQARITRVTVTMKNVGSKVEVQINETEGNPKEPIIDTVSTIMREELQLLNSVIRMLKSWEYPNGFRTEDHELWQLIGDRIVVITFEPTKVEDIDIGIVIS